jgi:lysophospholipase L1-like esterase
MARPSAARRLAAAGAALLLVAAAGCSSDEARPQARTSHPAAPTSASPTPADPPRVYVAVGASETVGVGADDPATQAWPRVLHDRALAGTRFVDVGVSGATVRDALTGQLARALAEEPDVVTVWLAVNDVLSLVPVADYEQSLDNLVRALRQGGRTEVLVGNVPPLDRLPAYRACLPGSQVTDVPCTLPLVPAPAEVRATVAEFNTAIGRVVAREGAVLVDLSAERDLASLTSGDGFHPSTRGHRVVARAFAAALRSA